MARIRKWIAVAGATVFLIGGVLVARVNGVLVNLTNSGTDSNDPIPTETGIAPDPTMTLEPTPEYNPTFPPTEFPEGEPGVFASGDFAYLARTNIFCYKDGDGTASENAIANVEALRKAAQAVFEEEGAIVRVFDPEWAEKRNSDGQTIRSLEMWKDALNKQILSTDTASMTSATLFSEKPITITLVDVTGDTFTIFIPNETTFFFADLTSLSPHGIKIEDIRFAERGDIYSFQRLPVPNECRADHYVQPKAYNLRSIGKNLPVFNTGTQYGFKGRGSRGSQPMGKRF